MFLIFIACVSNPDSGGPATSPCADEARAGPLQLGASFPGAEVDATVLALDPDPVVVGDNQWTFELTRPDCEVEATTFMPDHGHAGPLDSARVDGSTLTLDGLQLTMGGYWEVTLELACEATSDTVVVQLCVES